jgi:hypothetical protein
VPTIPKSIRSVAAGLMLGGLLFAQTPSGKAASSPAQKKSSTAAKPTPKSANVGEWRSECSKAGGFCIQVPSTWKALGDVFDGAGFVVAEPDVKRPQDDWNQITASATDMPDSTNGQERPTTDELIDIILGSPSSGIQAETLQRSKSMIAGMPTEVLKVRLKAKESSTDAIEFIAMMDDGETIYSVALGCLPQDAARLEPIFDHVLHTWKATPPTAVPNTPAPPSSAPAPKDANEPPAPPKK